MPPRCIGAATCLAYVLALDRLPDPGYVLAYLIEQQVLRAGNVERLLPCGGMTVGAGDHQPVPTVS